MINALYKSIPAAWNDIKLRVFNLSLLKIFCQTPAPSLLQITLYFPRIE